MESLSAWFEGALFPPGNAAPLRGETPPALTVIGSGGKTSLIWLLARHFARPGAANRERRVLVAPSTKMHPPAEAVPGVETAGIFNRTSGKLEALPPEELEKTAAAFDIVLIEGDGSRGLPLKAWKPGEPVVPPFTTASAGLIPPAFLGEAVSEKIIHRLPLFLELSGAAEGEPLRSEHLLRVITGYKGIPGLFAAARGKKILFFNQTEDDAALRKARELTAMLPPAFGLYAVIAGSVRHNRVEPLYRSISGTGASSIV